MDQFIVTWAPPPADGGRMLQGELTHHLGYERYDAVGQGSGNSRNGTSPKTLKGELGEMVIDVPRDRNGEFAGLKGFLEAIESVYPEAQVQHCIVYAVKASLNYVNWKERKAVAADLKPIYRAASTRRMRWSLCIVRCGRSPRGGTRF